MGDRGRRGAARDRGGGLPMGPQGRSPRAHGARVEDGPARARAGRAGARLEPPRRGDRRGGRGARLLARGGVSKTMNALPPDRYTPAAVGWPWFSRLFSFFNSPSGLYPVVFPSSPPNSN